MSQVKVFTIIGIALVFVITLHCAGATTAPATKEAAPLQSQSNSQIIDQIDRLTQKHDLKGLQDLAQGIQEAFRQSNPDRYAQLTLRLTNELGTFEFNNPRHYAMASSLAVEALKIADKYPVTLEVGLASHLRVNSFRGAELPQMRTKQMKLWIHAYKRLNAASNLPVDPTYSPQLNPVIPGFEDLPTGVAPGFIKDPQRRKEYVEALAAERAKAAQYHTREEARRLMPRLLGQLEDFAVSAYSRNPTNDAELSDLLGSGGMPPGERTRIMEMVRQYKPS